MTQAEARESPSLRTLQGYDLKQLLRETRSTAVYRGSRVHDGFEVIAKFYLADKDSEEGHFEHEYDLLRSLDVEGAVEAVDLLRSGQQRILILKRFPGIDLDKFLEGRPIDIETFLLIAVKVTTILSKVHARRIIHRDIKPTSILIDPSSLEVCLADFGISVALERDHQEIYDPGVLSGTLPYLAPEQTGRTTRGVDERSDLYSLGATFYEMLVGHPPFTDTEPLRLVHAHLARVPVSLSEIRPELPSVLAEIVARLLAKDPVDRYQSARGLLHDLERCQRERQGFEVPSFELGAEDSSSLLALPDRLYGRGQEIDRLTNAFEQASKGRVELVLLHGPSGIGKTALIQSLQPVLADRKGYFAAGKFEQFRSNTPLLGITQALAQLIDRLLIEDEERLGRWKRALQRELDASAAVLVPLVPELEVFVGSQPQAPELGALESRNRLLVSLGRLVATIAAPEHPVVLFLDDLQWSDPISLRVLEQIVTASGARGLLVIGAYRSDEVEEGHPLHGLAKRVEDAVEIGLKPLSESAVIELIVDALKLPRDRAAELAAAIAGRTDNNPLLVRQLLQLLAQEGALRREPEGWTWSTDAVRKSGIPSDAIGMIKAKLERLAVGQREVLAAATCVGSRFDLSSLGAALERRPAELLPTLNTLADEGLLALSESIVQFTHDRIEEGARHFLDPELERRYHLRIGRHLRETSTKEELQDRLFDIVDHLNRTIEVVDEGERLWELAELDLRAGESSLRASASTMAERYLDAGLRAFERARELGAAPSDRPEDQKLGLALRVQHARCVSLKGDYERASSLFDDILRSGLDTVEYAKVAYIRVDTCMIAGRHEDSILHSLDGLAKLGIHVSRSPSLLVVLTSLVRMKWEFRAKVRAELPELPECDDDVAQLRMAFLARLVGPAFIVGGNLAPVLITLAGRESVRAGKTPDHGFYLALVGMLMAGALGDYKGALELGNRSLELIREPDVPRRGITLLLVSTIVMHWTQPYSKCFEGVESAFELALEEGDLAYATYSAVHRVGLQSTMGRPLDVVRIIAQEAARFASNTGMAELAGAIRARLHMSEVLEGHSSHKPLEPGDFEQLYPRCVAVSGHMQLLVVLNRGEEAFALSELVNAKVDEGLLGFYQLPEFVFYRGMAAALSLDEPRSDRESALRRALRTSHKKYRKWVEVYADNLGAHARLLEAEVARLRGRTEQAQGLYEQAARAAHDRYPQIEALIWERLGRLMVARGWDGLARAPLTRAHELYDDWGATTKVTKLRREFPDIRFQDPFASAIPYNVQETVSNTTTTMSMSLDVASVLKSTLGITRGQGHREVVSSVLGAAIENAGAQRGALLQQIDGKLHLVVEHNGEGSTGRIREPVPLTEAGTLIPASLIRLVARSRESRIVHDARIDPRLGNDPSTRANRPLSIACVPIHSQNQLVGVLYLENRLVTGVFTPDRLQLLEHLAAQAAISLQSARLFDDLRGSEAQWRSLVEHAPDNIAIVDSEGRIEFINRGVITDGTELVGQPMSALFAEECRDRVELAIAAVFRTGDNKTIEGEVLGETEEERRWWTTRLSPIIREGDNGAEDEVMRVTLISTDDTEHRKLEGQLRQSQKMEAVGTLAGGVAHDFNNLLSVILGSAELAREGLYPTDEALDEIMGAAERASGLTRQLLAFSRKQVLQPRVIDLNETVNAMIKMLRRLLGENMELSLELQDGLGWIRVDPGQLEQVLLNLVVNARDAMPQGGEIVLTTESVELSPSKLWRHEDLKPGRYSMLCVRDSGVGMDLATRERIFDPFFTTKAAGKGTGLGLSTVHGIVEQSGGLIEVESEVGRGTSFFVHFPVVDASLDASTSSGTDELPGGRETILVVEDEGSVRKLLQTILTQQGYTVIEAEDGEQALAIAKDADWIDMLLTDVVLPKVSGSEVAEQILKKFRDMAVLYISGYTDDALMRHGVDTGQSAFLAKPFTREDLARRVRQVLDE